MFGDERWWKRGQWFGAEFVRAVHGDCLLVAVRDAASESTVHVRVRLARVSDRVQARGPAANDTPCARRVWQLCQGEPLMICPKRVWPDPYGRIVAEVMLHCGAVDAAGPSCGLNLSTFLLREGHVVRWRGLRGGRVHSHGGA